MKHFTTTKHWVTFLLLPLFLVFSCQPNEDPDLLEDDSLHLLSLEETLASFDDGSDDPGEAERGFRRGPRFRTLTKALVVTGLLPVIIKNKLTIFAPTDKAFKQIGLTARNIRDVENLKEILLYHVVAGKVFANDLVPGFVPTLNGAAVEVNLSGGVFINQAEVIKPDVRFIRGVLHIVDEVLLPPTQNIVEIAQGNDDFSILVEAVIKAGLAGELSGEGPFTVFAPTNDAFVELLGILGATDLDDIPLETLTAVLLYHVVEGRVYSSDLTSGSVNTLGGGSFIVDVPSLTIDDSGSTEDANLVPAGLDIQGTNGVIHVVDKVLLP